jgi:hypothetical protein
MFRSIWKSATHFQTNSGEVNFWNPFDNRSSVTLMTEWMNFSPPREEKTKWFWFQKKPTRSQILRECRSTDRSKWFELILSDWTGFVKITFERSASSINFLSDYSFDPQNLNCLTLIIVRPQKKLPRYARKSQSWSDSSPVQPNGSKVAKNVISEQTKSQIRLMNSRWQKERSIIPSIVWSSQKSDFEFPIRYALNRW